MLQRMRRGPEFRRDPSRLPCNLPHQRLTRSLLHDNAGSADLAHVRDPLMARVEAALFGAEEPMTRRALSALVESPRSTDSDRAIAALQVALDSEGCAFQIVELAGGFQLLTRPVYFSWLARLRQGAGEGRLTATLLETLAIVAYRQPIMRADLEVIRGVDCRDSLHELMDRGLVRISGRDESLGRPILYSTTKRFLQLFGLRDLSDLPPLETVKK
jgi:segregation and condensation protein B